jgi:hypothetical protein
MNELDFLQAVDRLMPRWTDVLSTGDMRTLAAWLQESPRDDPEAVRQTVNRTLDLLQGYPQAKSALGRELGIRSPLESVRLLFSPAPGGPQPIPATTIMVCPEDPSHYQRPLMFQGQRLFCPQHQVELVPRDSLPSED